MTEEQVIQKHERMGLECFVAVAVLGGTAIAGIAGAGISASASSSAAASQANSANQAAQLQEQQYEQNRQDQAPYRAAGTAALNTIGQDQANGTGFAAPFNFTADPGYQFQLQQGQNAINNSASATSGTLNGGTLKALDQYTTGLANTTYGDAYNRYLENSNQQYGQLAGIASLGEGATANTGAAGTAAANASGNYLTQAGNATAAGAVGVGNAINSGLSSLGNAANTYGVMQGLQSASSYGARTPLNFTNSPDMG